MLCVSKYSKGSNISVTCLRYSANHNALDIWPIRAHLAFQNNELCKKSTCFRKAGQRGATIMFGMWKLMCFLNLKPHKHIALNQIHQILFFLTTSYNPFKLILEFPSCFLYLWSISCFISMPCLSRSSLWAKAQSTGSIGVSTQGVRSRSWRACSGWLKRNTWLLPKMIRFPTNVRVNTKKKNYTDYTDMHNSV